MFSAPHASVHPSHRPRAGGHRRRLRRRGDGSKEAFVSLLAALGLSEGTAPCLERPGEDGVCMTASSETPHTAGDANTRERVLGPEPFFTPQLVIREPLSKRGCRNTAGDKLGTLACRGPQEANDAPAFALSEDGRIVRQARGEHEPDLRLALLDEKAVKEALEALEKQSKKRFKAVLGPMVALLAAVWAAAPDGTVSMSDTDRYGPVDVELRHWGELQRIQIVAKRKGSPLLGVTGHTLEHSWLDLDVAESDANTLTFARSDGMPVLKFHREQSRWELLRDYPPPPWLEAMGMEVTPEGRLVVDPPVQTRKEALEHWLPVLIETGAGPQVIFRNTEGGGITSELRLKGSAGNSLTATVAPHEGEADPRITWHIGGSTVGDLDLPPPRNVKFIRGAAFDPRVDIPVYDAKGNILRFYSIGGGESDRSSLERGTGAGAGGVLLRNSGGSGRRTVSHRGKLQVGAAEYDVVFQDDGSLRLVLPEGTSIRDSEMLFLIASLQAARDLDFSRVDFVRDGQVVASQDVGIPNLRVSEPLQVGQALGSHAGLQEAYGTPCFPKGTLVHTADGTKPIETIQSGDLVWAQDARTRVVALKPVLRVFEAKNQPLLSLTLQSDVGASHELRSTREHPFWVKGRGWVAAHDLAHGDLLTSLGRGSNGGSAGAVAVLHVERLPQRATVHNFEVDGFHSYFVGDHALWVHNSSSREEDTGPRAAGEGAVPEPAIARDQAPERKTAKPYDPTAEDRAQDAALVEALVPRIHNRHPLLEGLSLELVEAVRAEVRSRALRPEERAILEFLAFGDGRDIDIIASDDFSAARHSEGGRSELWVQVKGTVGDFNAPIAVEPPGTVFGKLIHEGGHHFERVGNAPHFRRPDNSRSRDPTEEEPLHEVLKELRANRYESGSMQKAFELTAARYDPVLNRVLDVLGMRGRPGAEVFQAIQVALDAGYDLNAAPYKAEKELPDLVRPLIDESIPTLEPHDPRWAWPGYLHLIDEEVIVHPHRMYEIIAPEGTYRWYSGPNLNRVFLRDPGIEPGTVVEADGVKLRIGLGPERGFAHPAPTDEELGRVLIKGDKESHPHRSLEDRVARLPQWFEQRQGWVVQGETDDLVTLVQANDLGQRVTLTMRSGALVVTPSEPAALAEFLPALAGGALREVLGDDAGFWMTPGASGAQLVPTINALRRLGFLHVAPSSNGLVFVSRDAPTQQRALAAFFEGNGAFRANLASSFMDDTPFAQALRQRGWRVRADGEIMIPGDAEYESLFPSSDDGPVLAARYPGVDGLNRPVLFEGPVPPDHAATFSIVSDREFLEHYAAGVQIMGAQDAPARGDFISGAWHDGMHRLAAEVYPDIARDVQRRLGPVLANPQRYEELASSLFHLVEYGVRAKPGLPRELDEWGVIPRSHRGKVVEADTVREYIRRWPDRTKLVFARRAVMKTPSLVDFFGAIRFDEVWGERSIRADRRLAQLLDKVGDSPTAEQMEEIDALAAEVYANLHNWSLIPPDDFVAAYFGDPRYADVLETLTDGFAQP